MILWLNCSRKIWAAYFDKLKLRVIFWSAKIAEDIRKAEKLAEKLAAGLAEVDSDDEVKGNGEEVRDEEEEEEEIKEEGEEEIKEEEDLEETEEDDEIDSDESYDEDEDDVTVDGSSDEEFVSADDTVSDSNDDASTPPTAITDDTFVVNSSRMIGVDEIVSLLESIQIKTPHEAGLTTVGLVGYPNVGKSSTINAIFGRKKVSVSATPGHTKRFQTLMVTDKLTFCDCPGLVMPSVVHSKGHLMVSGILPIDTIRDYIAPINIVAEQFPRETLELLYGIQLPPVRDGEDRDRPPTARELLSSYSCETPSWG